MTLGEKIRALRLARGLTLQGIADAFGINRASVAGWEAGKTKPEVDKIPALARILGTTADVLLSSAPIAKVADRARPPVVVLSVTQADIDALDEAQRRTIVPLLNVIREAIRKPDAKRGPKSG